MLALVPLNHEINLEYESLTVCGNTCNVIIIPCVQEKELTFMPEQFIYRRYFVPLDSRLGYSWE